jgi:hypothetical protein
MHRCVDLLGMKLARPTSLYELGSILKGRRPVKVVLKGFTNQCVGRHVIPTLTSMDLYEQLTSLLLGNTPH